MKYLLILVCIFFISVSSILAQDKSKVQKDDAPKPDIYIDGKKYDYEIFDLLDKSKIESISVIKDEQALREYKAPHGLVLVKSKKAAQRIITIEDKELNIADRDKEPVIIIDGKISDKATLTKLSTDDIESIDVFKDQKAMDLYNAPYGAVVVKTKNPK